MCVCVCVCVCACVGVCVIAPMRLRAHFVAQLFRRCQESVAGTDWIQLSHLCSYDIGWCRYFQQDYAAALPLFLTLQQENKWSKAFYAYMVAVRQTPAVLLSRCPRGSVIDVCATDGAG